MKDNQKSIEIKSLLLGMAAGAGAAAAAARWLYLHPQASPVQLSRNAALERALARARAAGPISLDADHKYVIFSDHHKGGRDQADEFRFSEQTYLAALDHYHSQGFTLIILGDAEELWEQRIPQVLKAYANVFKSEARFFPQRYLRVSGNHDNAWKIEQHVQQYLYPFFPGIQVRQELIFGYNLGSGVQGLLLLIHGHQGTLDADIFDFVPPIVLPFFREFQNLTNLLHISPSKDNCLRGLQDTQMYRWASTKKNLVLIAGHTHRPVWSSLTHLDKLVLGMHAAKKRKPGQRSIDHAQKLQELMVEIEARRRVSPDCNDTLKTKPCYFNTGCCCFDDGDITGIEIVNGEMRLVRWGKQEDAEPGSPVRFERSVLENQQLEEIFITL